MNLCTLTHQRFWGTQGRVQLYSFHEKGALRKKFAPDYEGDSLIHGEPFLNGGFLLKVKVHPAPICFSGRPIFSKPRVSHIFLGAGATKEVFGQPRSFLVIMRASCSEENLGIGRRISPQRRDFITKVFLPNKKRVLFLPKIF